MGEGDGTRWGKRGGERGGEGGISLCRVFEPLLTYQRTHGITSGTDAVFFGSAGIASLSLDEDTRLKSDRHAFHAARCTSGAGPICCPPRCPCGSSWRGAAERKEGTMP